MARRPRPRGRSGLAIAAMVAGIGCAAPSPAPAPSLPAGIAEIRLPADAESLRRIAAEEEATGALARRREILAGLNRQLLMAPPENVLAPELFDFVVALATRMELGAVSSAWGSYLYTTYQRDLHAERPDGRPRRPPREIEAALDGWIEFYRIRANPRVPAPSVESEGFEGLREWRNERRIGR
jgi:hypothetical protein